jgi:ketosteroid isomerase-like protein
MMTTQQIASRLAALFRENKWEQAQSELFDENAVSIEPYDELGLATVQGIEAIKRKTEEFNKQIEEVHSGYVTDPIVAGKYIAFGMGMDATNKKGERIKMDEIAIYEVNEGKIVKEQFFY